METLIKEFLTFADHDGYGYGSGYGYGYGYGYGSGSGYDDGYGDGYGDGSGYGDGDGYGSGSGYGDGSGSGDGSGDGIQAVSKRPVYQIDGVQTILNHIHGDIAEGFILQSDLTLTPCYVVKENGVFAHGATMREAFDALQEKLYDDRTEEERLIAFKEHFPAFGKKYPAKELFAWHHVLTGSCKAGRLAFCLDKGIDLEKDTYSVVEFIRLTKDAYGGEMIRKLVAD